MTQVRGIIALSASTVMLMAPGVRMECCAQSSSSESNVTPAVQSAREATAKPAIRPDASSQSSWQADPPEEATDRDNRLGVPFLKNLVRDQQAIWTSPVHIRTSEATLLVPIAGLTAAMIATDSSFSRHLSSKASTLDNARYLSDFGVGTFTAVGAGLYLWGHVNHNDHSREAGILSGEAAISSLAVVTALKYATGRERPLTDGGQGRFWNGGDSFVSDHSAISWSIASVLAHEYPGPFTKLLAYGLASAVSLSRVKAKQHFPSDVLVGSTVGWLAGWQVYRSRHNPGVGGGGWESLGLQPDRDGKWSSKNMGSPYVPLDSWIYPAFERLAALGYTQTQFLGMRPWTRLECARLVQNADERIRDEGVDLAEATHLYSSLEQEFGNELNLLGGGTNRKLRLESVYSRVTGISGEPLRDGYHFGQTLVNDVGRPYAEGMNNVSGISGWASEGPFVGYVRAEFQHAPSGPALPLSARQVISNVDSIPLPPAMPVSQLDRFRLLDAYVGMNFENWQITFGKQSQWWGPDAGGPMVFSTNAEPIDMLQINRVSPFKLPSILGILGPIRGELLLGQLTGQNFVLISGKGVTGSFTRSLSPQPFLVGEKVSFKPTPNLEVGFGLTTITGGPGDPFTFKKFLEAMFPLGGGAAGTPGYFGNGHSEFDFTYRVPGVRNWLTLYVDGFTGDEPSPVLGAWDKAAWTAGIYIPRIPGIPKLDFRAEGLYSDPPIGGTVSHGFFYIGTSYPNGYTNAGNLIGSWIGRQGQGAQAWTTYWLSPKNSVQFNYRHQKVSQQFISGGGTVNDAGAQANLWLRPDFSLATKVQYEKWDFPVLATTAQTNVAASLEITFWPSHRRSK